MKLCAVGLIASVLCATSASAEICPADRTPVEMVGHTLCLLNAALPKIHRDQNGSVTLLVWSNPERLPPDAQLPPGTFHLIVEKGEMNTPSLEQTVPSDLPDMLRVPYFDRVFYYSMGPIINGQPIWLECNAAIAPHRKSGAQDCIISAMVASGIRVEVHLGTVDWSGPAWPRLDERWTETWPPYLAGLEAGINVLFSIQQ